MSDYKSVERREMLAIWRLDEISLCCCCHRHYTMSLLRSAARRLGLGKYRYWQGTDLQGACRADDERALFTPDPLISFLPFSPTHTRSGNNFFERPHPEFPGE